MLILDGFWTFVAKDSNPADLAAALELSDWEFSAYLLFKSKFVYKIWFNSVFF